MRQLIAALVLLLLASTAMADSGRKITRTATDTVSYTVENLHTGSNALAGFKAVDSVGAFVGLFRAGTGHTTYGSSTVLVGATGSFYIVGDASATIMIVLRDAAGVDQLQATIDSATTTFHNSINVVGVASATTFVGDGSGLTGIAPVGNDPTKVLKTGDTMTGGLTVDANIVTSGNVTAATGTVTATDMNLSGNASAAFLYSGGGNMAGDLTVEASVITSGNVTAATGTVTAGAINTSGNATAAFFFGDGSNLTGVIDTTKVLKSGDTMTGALTVEGGVTTAGNITAATSTITATAASLSGNATAAFFFGDGSNLTNVTGTDSTRVLRAGDTMTGALTVEGGITTSGDITAATGTVFAGGISAATATLTDNATFSSEINVIGDAQFTRIGIGTSAPLHDVVVSGVADNSAAEIKLQSAANKDSRLLMFGDREWVLANDSSGSLGATDQFHIYDSTVGSSRVTIDTAGDVTIANSLGIDGNATAAFFFGDGSNLTSVLGTDITKVLKAGDTMTGSLTVEGDVTTSGDITAATGTVTATDLSLSGNATAVFFFGDGSNLTDVDAETLDGLDSASFTLKAGDTMTGPLTVEGGITTDGDITAATGTVTATDLNISGNATAATIAATDINLSGNATAAFFYGDGSAVTNVDAETLDTLDSTDFTLKAGDTMTGALTVEGGIITDGNITASTGTITATDLDVSGNATAAYFFGDGSNVTGVISTDSTKVLKAGDTMTGDLTVDSSIVTSGDITAATGTVDAATITISGLLDLEGSLYASGEVFFEAAPQTAATASVDNDLTNKAYVDAQDLTSFVEATASLGISATTSDTVWKEKVTVSVSPTATTTYMIHYTYESTTTSTTKVADIRIQENDTTEMVVVTQAPDSANGYSAKTGIFFVTVGPGTTTYDLDFKLLIAPGTVSVRRARFVVQKVETVDF